MSEDPWPTCSACGGTGEYLKAAVYGVVVDTPRRVPCDFCGALGKTLVPLPEPPEAK